MKLTFSIREKIDTTTVWQEVMIHSQIKFSEFFKFQEPFSSPLVHPFLFMAHSIHTTIQNMTQTPLLAPGLLCHTKVKV